MEKNKVALVSVSDKSGLEGLARALKKHGFEIISTGGTARALEEAGVKVTRVESVTRFREMLGGRVKTLHPKIHAGILAKRSKKEHLSALSRLGIKPIDIVVVNLYPFRETIGKKGVSIEDAVENIDIGGPTLVRAAAKNHESVAVVTSPKQYASIIKELEKNKGCISDGKRKELAVRAFELTASYDAAISSFLHNKFLASEKFPQTLMISLEKDRALRYGENWHQEAAFYKDPSCSGCGIAGAVQVHGKEMSFNNINDANAAISLVKEFKETSVAIIKHANPCGVSSDNELSIAFRKALDCDRTSAFGSVIALNRQCDAATALQIVSFFNEIIIAPSFEEAAMDVLVQKKNLRVLRIPRLGKSCSCNCLEFRSVEGGALVQTPDSVLLNDSEYTIVSKRVPSELELKDMLFGFAVAKHAKSNAIVLAKDLATVGVGAGQMSRIDATEIAVKKSAGRCKGSALASDAFFPFRDNVDLAAKSGITAIIQPGGSLKDKEVIEAADKHNIAMLFTGVRHFKH